MPSWSTRYVHVCDDKDRCLLADHSCTALSNHRQLDQLHGATALASPSSHTRKMSSSGLSPLSRPHEFSSGGSGGMSALFGSSPPAHSLGPPMQPVKPTAGSATAQQPSGSSQAHPLPQTNNPTPHDTPELGASRSSVEPQNFYSSHGESDGAIGPDLGGC